MRDPTELSRRRAAAATRGRRRRVQVALATVVALAAAVVALADRGEHHKAPAPIHYTKPPQGSPKSDATTAAVSRLAGYGLPVYCAGRTKPMVALTFDDGPGPYTRLVVAKLRKHHARATFFLVGRSIDHYPGLARIELAVSVPADHTLTHPFLPGLSAAAAEQEIAGAATQIAQATGRSVNLFRPPYGARNAAIDDIARRNGLLEIVWDVDSGDSAGANYAGIERNVIRNLHPGAIVLMHENRGQTVRALLTIFAALEARHLRAVTLPELLAADPPTLAQLRAGGRGCG